MLGKWPGSTLARFAARSMPPLKPDNALTLLYRGNLLTETGHVGRALQDYQRLIAQAPDFDEAWFRLGGALWLLERRAGKTSRCMAAARSSG